MTPYLQLIYQLLILCSLLLLAIAVLLHARRVSKQFSRFKLDDIKHRLDKIEKEMHELQRETAALQKESAGIKIRTKTLEGEVTDVKEASNRYLNVFKTVLYGFDYIVQGCKNAIESHGEETPEEKQIETDIHKTDH
jgi:hypothetical protein